MQSWLRVNFHPSNLPVARAKSCLMAAIIKLTFDQLQENQPVMFFILGINVFEEKGVEGRLHFEASYSGPGRVDENPIAKFVELENDFFDAFDHAAVFDFATVERFG